MVGGLFCDVQKAFDCVNHNVLLTKLEFYGITGITYQLLKSYLKGRYQRVVLNNDSSMNRMFIGPCIIIIVEELETNLMSLVIFITLNICSTCFEH